VKPFSWRDCVRYQSGLHHSAIHVAAAIAELFYRRRHLPGQAFPMTLDELRTETGMRSRNTVRKWRDQLIEAGWLVRTAQWQGNARRADLYRLTIPTHPVEPLVMGAGVEPITRGSTGAGVEPITRAATGAGVEPMHASTFHAQHASTRMDGDERSESLGESHTSRAAVELVATTRLQPAAADRPPPLGQLLDELGIRRRRQAGR
jgi:hypothetical protein